ncbi:MAG: ThuA protein [Novosphingobium sp.]|nr:ThuA protein [Novosphingobium sp.]
MKRILQSIGAATCLWGAVVPAAHAASPALVDCPLRDAPYSTSTPLIDVLLNDRAKAIADKALPGVGTRLPPQFAGTNPPSFASILTLKEAAGFLRLPALDLAAVDRQLAAIPVTRADKIVRCPL